MAGFLLSPNYQDAIPTIDDLTIASLIWGFTLSTGMFAANKAYTQTRTMWKRSRRVQAYGVMVWAEWTVSTVIGIISWCFIRGFVRARYVEPLRLTSVRRVNRGGRERWTRQAKTNRATSKCCARWTSELQ